MNLLSVLHRRDNIENLEFWCESINISVMPGRSQQRNYELKSAAQSCSKLTDLFKRLRLDDQYSTNESLNNVTDKFTQEELRLFKKIFISFLLLLTFSFYMDHFWLHIITQENKIRGFLSFCCNTRIIMYNLLFQ